MVRDLSWLIFSFQGVNGTLRNILGSNDYLKCDNELCRYMNENIPDIFYLGQWFEKRPDKKVVAVCHENDLTTTTIRSRWDWAHEIASPRIVRIDHHVAMNTSLWLSYRYYIERLNFITHVLAVPFTCCDFCIIVNTRHSCTWFRPYKLIKTWFRC